MMVMVVLMVVEARLVVVVVVKGSTFSQFTLFTHTQDLKDDLDKLKEMLENQDHNIPQVRFLYNLRPKPLSIVVTNSLLAQ